MRTTTGREGGERATGDQKPSIVEVLVSARKLIEKPEHWCQHDYTISNDAATSYCSLGALIVASGDTTTRNAAKEFLHRAVGDMGNGSLSMRISTFNDAPTRTHAEVLAAFDRAIELATNSAVGSPAQSNTQNEEGVVP